MMNSRIPLAAACLLAACGNPGGGGGDDQEVITTITLKFRSVAGTEVTAEFNDDDGDGGNPPTIDPITIAAGMHTLYVGFENRLESPPEIITDEVLDEGVDHQVFFALNGPLSHAYYDNDTNGLPIGLMNMIDAFATTSGGQLTVTLRHMPPINGQPVKDGTTEAGTIDATATFPISIQ